MKLVGLIDEDFTQYKKPSMFIAVPFCDFKCDKDNGTHECQNWELSKAEQLDISSDDLIKRYLDNNITEAIVFGGLEPFYRSFEEIYLFIQKLRWDYSCFDDVVIYTGYYPEEVFDKLSCLSKFANVIVKFGRYKPGQKPHFDEVLGVELANDEQWAEEL